MSRGVDFSINLVLTTIKSSKYLLIFLIRSFLFFIWLDIFFLLNFNFLEILSIDIDSHSFVFNKLRVCFAITA